MRRSRVIGMILGVVACVSVIGCGGPAPSTAKTESPAASAPAEQRFDLKGTVVAIDPSKSSVTVKHDEIKGFMSAMTMGYSVKDPKALDALAKGDVVTAKLVSTGEGYWLEDVKVIEHAKN